MASSAPVSLRYPLRKIESADDYLEVRVVAYAPPDFSETIDANNLNVVSSSDTLKSSGNLCAAKIFFKLLAKVEWTRATGGYIWGKNEYDEDAERESFTTSSCRTKECYGPIGEAHKKELRRIRGF